MFELLSTILSILVGAAAGVCCWIFLGRSAIDELERRFSFEYSSIQKYAFFVVIIGSALLISLIYAK